MITTIHWQENSQTKVVNIICVGMMILPWMSLITCFKQMNAISKQDTLHVSKRAYEERLKIQYE